MFYLINSQSMYLQRTQRYYLIHKNNQRGYVITHHRFYRINFKFSLNKRYNPFIINTFAHDQTNINTFSSKI
ncbi:hypothetical protein DXC49_17190 [Bacteroides fragilis]|uniref:Uncharacterized protein n=1 Tax=Bacteroides fragilis TaxID=817 RepID=A0A5C6L554_BACFG|nr:hypothetical protein DXC49_17190 [Bacteroides fragilis]RHI15949.1 hypothetical protein DW176_17775 [Bacteroides fragilis]RHI28407.1 hypothetical protein DW170_18720 [Bacteroides fragilis]TWV69676.1 hypothetical protein FSA08_18075 [Bacteroides fragilis]